MHWNIAAQHVVDALAFGSTYALYALGIAIIFGVMRLINFAHGQLIMAGGFAIYFLFRYSILLALVGGLLVSIALALGTERVAFRRLRMKGASPATLLITSFAVSYLLQNLAGLLYGYLPRTTLAFAGLSRPLSIGSLRVPRLDIVTVVTTVVLLVALHGFLEHSLLGTQMRAAAEDFTTARLLGVNADRVIAMAFAISGFLAFVAAVLMVGQLGSVNPNTGVSAVLYAFIATVLGGLGSLRGAVLGGFLMGAMTVVLQVVLPDPAQPFRDAILFAGVLILLVVRPSGLIPPVGVVERV